VRNDLPDSFYHIYGRGSVGRIIFKDDQDKNVFLGLLQRYLGRKVMKNRFNAAYPNFYGEVELSAYCLMGTHFHLLLWQQNTGGIAKLMQSVLVSYTRYYNKKYTVRGALLESRYLSSRVGEDNYLLHLTRYIHLNPPDYRDYLWSSLPYYVSGLRDDWMHQERIIDMYDLKPESYWELLADYEEKKDELNNLKNDFADRGESIKNAKF
jgi:REP element-mobilizing transposase RayT